MEGYNPNKPWLKGLQERESLIVKAEFLLINEANKLYIHAAENKEDPLDYFRQKLFALLTNFISRGSLVSGEKAEIIDILRILGYDEFADRALGVYLRERTEEDEVFIYTVITAHAIQSIANFPENDLYGFVDSYLKAPQEKWAAVKYIRNRNPEEVKDVLDAELLGVLDEYAEDEVLRDRLITYIEIKSAT